MSTWMESDAPDIRLFVRTSQTDADKVLASAGGRGRRGGPGGVDVWFSLVICTDSTVIISDVRWGGPADKALLVPGQKILTVDGQAFSGTGLHEAIQNVTAQPGSIHLTVQIQEVVSTADVVITDAGKIPTSF